MSIQDLGSIGELIAALATVATLAYLAIQVHHNTRALKASTFQNISSEMGQNVVPLLTTPDMAEIFVKSVKDPSVLTDAELLKVQAQYLATIRKLESIFVQSQLGSIDQDYVKGFELSLISTINSPLGIKWWESAKPVFYAPFVKHVEAKLAAGSIPDENPAIVI